MKKNFSFLLFILAAFLQAQAQLNWKEYVTTYGGSPSDKTPMVMTALKAKSFAFTTNGVSFEGDTSLNHHLKGRKQDNLSMQSINDSSAVHYFVRNINPQNASNFEYRILHNGSATLVHWSSITQFAERLPEKETAPLAYLGAYKAPVGDYLIVDIRRKGYEKLLSSTLTFWPKRQPQLLTIYKANELDQFLKRLNATSTTALDSIDRLSWQKQYAPEELDTITSLPKRLVLPADEKNLIFFLKEKVTNADQLEYQVLKNGAIYQDWKSNDFDNNYIWLKNLDPGNYQLRMRFSIQRENITEYPFKIEPRLNQTFVFKLITGSLIAAFLGFILLSIRFVRQKRKLRWTQVRQEQVEIELKAIHSQLNPHFVFNALASIQGLINKNERESANQYLARFSKLLRDSLVYNEKRLVPLSLEIQTLETYLQLEQLRTPFIYQIHIEPGVDAPSIDIPPFLLQPMVENAVKHGIAQMNGKGELTIKIAKQEETVQIQIIDNGKGFRPTQATNGFGLKLTRKRIELLNESMKEAFIDLHIQEIETGGTRVVLDFKNWI